jgi:hypothetical protein
VAAPEKAEKCAEPQMYNLSRTQALILRINSLREISSFEELILGEIDSM